MATAPTTHDEYLSNLSAAKRAALNRLRQLIKRSAPQAEECISYRICAFRQDGMLVGYGATTQHCALFLMSNSTIAAHREDLREYDLSTGTVRFQPEKPLPAALVKKLVRSRLEENAARVANRNAKKRPSTATAGRKKSPGTTKKRGTTPLAKAASGKNANRKK